MNNATTYEENELVELRQYLQHSLIYIRETDGDLPRHLKIADDYLLTVGMNSAPWGGVCETHCICD